MRGAPYAAFAATAAMAVVTAVYGFVDDGTRLPRSEGGSVSGPGELMFSLMVVAFAALGTLLATRRPRNAIGWILCAASLALAVTGWARAWYVHAEYGAPGSQPVPDALLWFANWIFVWGFFPLVTALLLLFPDGRLPSRRWWPVAVLIGLALAFLTIGFAFEPGALDSYPRADNALGVGGTAGDVVDALQVLGYPVFLLAAIGSAAAIVTRFRRSRGVERQQLKWMAAAAAAAVLAWFANGVLDQTLGINSAFFLPIVLLAIPVSATVAILRYRLYDLGRIVNRTLVYGALTATLAVAALFRPARSRIQAAVDHRFYRRRYDAARTLETFGGRLRDEVDLDTLQRELVGVVGRTVQPAHVTLWLPRNDSRTHGP